MAVRPSGYSDREWFAAINDARRLSYPPQVKEIPQAEAKTKSAAEIIGDDIPDSWEAPKTSTAVSAFDDSIPF